MLNKKLIVQPIGPDGVYGSVEVSFVDGKLEAKVSLSPKAAIDAAAKETGWAGAPAAAQFVENAVGLN